MYRLAKILMLLGLGWASGSAQAYLVQVSQGADVWTVQPYTGSLSASANYNLSGLAANPVNGPRPQARQAQIWFYDGSDGLAWNVIFNVANAGGVGAASWTINISGNPSNANVLLSDDVGELRETSNNTSNVFNGAWRWANLTDGGVIGPLGGSSWTLTINPQGATPYTGLTGLQVAGLGGSIIPLQLTTAPIVFTPLLNGIPEPASALLLASGLVATLAWRRRKAGQQVTATSC